MVVVVVMVLVLVAAAAVVLVTRASAAGGGVTVRNPPPEYAEPGHCTVVLGEAGSRRSETITAVRRATDVGQAQARDWVDDAPCAIAGGLSRASADRIRELLAAAGATAWVEDRSVT